mgnify:CR=1 FL=1
MNEKKTRKPRQKKPMRTSRQILSDSSIITISVMEAAEILGINKTTAYAAIKNKGYFVEGVTVINAGGRLVVVLDQLRQVLGIQN